MKTTCLIIFGLCVLTSLANTSDLDEYKEILSKMEDELKIEKEEYNSMIANSNSSKIKFGVRDAKDLKRSREKVNKFIAKKEIRIAKEKRLAILPREKALAAKVEKYERLMELLDKVLSILESEEILKAAEANKEDFKPDEDLIASLNDEISKLKTEIYEPLTKSLAYSDLTVLEAEKEQLNNIFKDAKAKQIKEQWKLGLIAEDKESKAQEEILNKAKKETSNSKKAFEEKVKQIEEIESLPFDRSSGTLNLLYALEMLIRQNLEKVEMALLGKPFETLLKIKDEIVESEDQIKSLNRERSDRSWSLNEARTRKNYASDSWNYVKDNKDKSEEYKLRRKQIYDEAMAAWEKEKEEYELWESNLQKFEDKLKKLKEDQPIQEEKVAEMRKNLKLHFKNGDKLGENKDQILERCQKLLYDYHQSFDAFKTASEKQEEAIRDYEGYYYDYSAFEHDIENKIKDYGFDDESIKNPWDDDYYKDEEKVFFAELSLLYLKIANLEESIPKVKAYIERHQENTGSKLLKYSLIPAAGAAIAGGVVFFFSGSNNEKVNENDKEKQLFNLK